MSFENHDTNLQLSWKGQEGNCKPCLCWYKNGLVIAGPNEVQFWRRKSPEGWARVWSYVPKVPLEALVSATLKESLMFWTEAVQFHFLFTLKFLRSSLYFFYIFQA